MAFAALLGAVLSLGAAARPFEPQSLAFWDARHGLVQGYEVGGRYRQAVWLTTDGGRTWRTVKRGPGPYWIAAVRGGSAGWIALPGALLHSGDRGRTWSTFSRARVRELSFATATDGWAVSRSGLVATHDGGVRWHTLRQPCGSTFWTSPPKLALATPSHGWLLCVSTPGAGEQRKALYETRDGGTRWRPLPISRPEVVEAHAAELLDDRVGVALFFYARRLAFTRDGGRRWRLGYRFR